MIYADNAATTKMCAASASGAFRISLYDGNTDADAI